MAGAIGKWKCHWRLYLQKQPLWGGNRPAEWPSSLRWLKMLRRSKRRWSIRRLQDVIRLHCGKQFQGRAMPLTASRPSE
jgi:hypothetical protein